MSWKSVLRQSWGAFADILAAGSVRGRLCFFAPAEALLVLLGTLVDKLGRLLKLLALPLQTQAVLALAIVSTGPVMVLMGAGRPDKKACVRELRLLLSLLL